MNEVNRALGLADVGGVFVKRTSALGFGVGGSPVQPMAMLNNSDSKRSLLRVPSNYNGDNYTNTNTKYVADSLEVPLSPAEHPTSAIRSDASPVQRDKTRMFERKQKHGLGEGVAGDHLWEKKQRERVVREQQGRGGATAVGRGVGGRALPRKVVF